MCKQKKGMAKIFLPDQIKLRKDYRFKNSCFAKNNKEKNKPLIQQ